MSVPEYEYNYRSEYIPRMEAPIATKPDRRRFGQVDERDDRRVIKVSPPQPTGPALVANKHMAS